jgi:hypothetical protein
MLAAIKQAAMEAMEANGPIAITTGTVTNNSPLEVIVDQRFTLDADFLIVPESLTKYEIDVQHMHGYSGGTTESALPTKILIRRGLEAGDRLILLRVQGGQQYLILDRVVSA